MSDTLEWVIDLAGVASQRRDPAARLEHVLYARVRNDEATATKVLAGLGVAQGALEEALDEALRCRGNSETGGLGSARLG